MANTYVDYTATAAQTDFAFNFPYLEDEHVIVEINGVATTDFTIVTSPALKVVLDSGATAGDIVRVRRVSQRNTNLVDFQNGSVLTEAELDRAYLHNRYLAEEISELNDQSLQIAAGGTEWNAKGLRIKNVGTPTDTTDASTKLYVDNKVNQTIYGGDAPLKWQFTGDIGNNTTYTVTGAEVSGDTTYDVSINGLVQEPGVDFTVDPDTDTLTIVPTLSGGEDIVIIQRGFGVAVTGTVGSAQLVDGSITTEKLAADAVDGSKIADDSIDSEHYVDGSIDSVHLADDSIDSQHYVDGSIDEAHIADEAVTSSKISTTDSVFNVQSNGNVGIGTNSPAKKLEVHGDIIAEAGNVEVSNGGSANGQGMYSPAANELGFSTGGTERIRIDNNGSVGIATANPTVNLEVATSSGEAGTISRHIVLSRGTTNGAYFSTVRSELTVNDVSALILGVDSQNILTINDEGRVGINTTSPNSTLHVNGSLSKSSGSFRIDHPLKAETHDLVHSFIEAPQADNIYRGKVQLQTGRAEVNIDTTVGMTEGTFVALNREIQVFTSNETNWDAVKGRVEGNKLIIECQNTQSNATISWLVIGERQDSHMYDAEWTDEQGKVIVEPEKVISKEPKEEA